MKGFFLNNFTNIPEVLSAINNNELCYKPLSDGFYLEAGRSYMNRLREPDKLIEVSQEMVKVFALQLERQYMADFIVVPIATYSSKDNFKYFKKMAKVQLNELFNGDVHPQYHPLPPSSISALVKNFGVRECFHYANVILQGQPLPSKVDLGELTKLGNDDIYLKSIDMFIEANENFLGRSRTSGLEHFANRFPEDSYDELTFILEIEQNRQDFLLFKPAIIRGDAVVVAEMLTQRAKPTAKLLKLAHSCMRQLGANNWGEMAARDRIYSLLLESALEEGVSLLASDQLREKASPLKDALLLMLKQSTSNCDFLTPYRINKLSSMDMGGNTRQGLSMEEIKVCFIEALNGVDIFVARDYQRVFELVQMDALLRRLATKDAEINTQKQYSSIAPIEELNANKRLDMKPKDKVKISKKAKQEQAFCRIS